MNRTPNALPDRLSRILWILLFLFLLFDLGYSFVQHYKKPIGGDLAQIVVPTPDIGYYHVQKDPFALDVLLNKKKYSNPNRYFAYRTTAIYFKTVPIFLQSFSPPLKSVYLSIGLIKTLIQMLLILLLAIYITGQRKIFNKTTLLAAALIIPFFQADGFNGTMGIIDHSVVYTLFYALPLALILLFFLPFFLSQKKMKGWSWQIISSTLLILLMIYLALNGPLVPGVVLVGAPVVFLFYIIKYYPDNSSFPFSHALWLSFKTIPGRTKIFLMGFMLLCLYSLYIGRYDIMNIDNAIPLTERYGRLFTGLVQLFTLKMGLPLLLTAILVNLAMIHFSDKTDESKRIMRLSTCILIFSILYISLLPLGGFRSYRPQIIRYDTFLPVTLGLVLLFGTTTMYHLGHLKKNGKLIYSIAMVLLLLVYVNADRMDSSAYTCEKVALETIAASKEAIVEVDCLCPVMEFRIVHDPNHSHLKADLLNYWGVTKTKKLFFQKEGCQE